MTEKDIVEDEIEEKAGSITQTFECFGTNPMNDDGDDDDNDDDSESDHQGWLYVIKGYL